uniref:Uncharacterized protein n=1 Tax=Rhizophagus irregularis (strain DAOM 181602 / DAOM 197198 / MUCL 43194) TaxID=747089 RepID=U9UUZ5_RHIID
MSITLFFLIKGSTSANASSSYGRFLGTDSIFAKNDNDLVIFVGEERDFEGKTL